MKLTTLQKDFLQHRLDAECTAECLAETEELGISLEEASRGTSSLASKITSSDIDFSSLDNVELEALEDCFSGSTWFANLEDAIALGEISKGKAMAMHKAVNALEDAIFHATGRKFIAARY